MGNWTTKDLGRGKYMLRNADGRCIAVVSFLAKPPVFERDTLAVLANANRMLNVCRLIKSAEGDSEQARSEAEAIIADIEGESCSR